MRSITAAVVAAFAIAGAAFADPPAASGPPSAGTGGAGVVTCPSAPQPPSESQRPAPIGPQPALPRCVDPVTHVGRCPRDVIPRYNAEVAAYNAQLEARASAAHLYIEALNDWVRDAQAYANCEVNVMNAENTH